MKRILTSVGALVLAICLLSTVKVVAADRVILGTGVDPSYGQAYIAAEAGIYAKHGLDVDVRLFSSGSAATPALIPGDINVAMTGVPSGVLNHALAPKVILIGHTNVLPGYNGAAASADVEKLEDLRGRKIGIARGTTSEFSATQALERVGLSLHEDTEVVYVDPPEMLAALLRDDIDAFFVWEPWITRAKMAGGDSVNLLSGVEFYTVQTAMVMDRTWVQENFDAAVRFTKAIIEAGEFARENPEEASEMVARFLRLDEELVSVLMAKQNFMVALTDEAIDYMRADVDALIDNDKLEAPFDYAAYIYTDVLEAIDPALVSFTGPLN